MFFLKYQLSEICECQKLKKIITITSKKLQIATIFIKFQVSFFKPSLYKLVSVNVSLSLNFWWGSPLWLEKTSLSTQRGLWLPLVFLSSAWRNLQSAKMFYRVNHHFLFSGTWKFGFSLEFINWIKAYIGAPWIAHSINESPNPLFLASQGLKQGFMLSPLLYILMVDSLSRNLENVSLDGALLILSIAKNLK